jgi:phosphoenolpyruvate---glycerone phosphotransferase subunit DhaL
MNRASELAGIAATGLAQAKDQLNELDAFAGDGDLGLTAATASSAILELLPDVTSAPGSELLKRIGRELSRRAPSTSGTLVAFGLLAAGRECAAQEPAYDAASLARILRVITTTVGTRGKSAVGDKTMLDALEPACIAAEAAAEQGVSAAAAARAAAAAAAAGAAATEGMQPRHGRASWLTERSAGHEDAGARLVAITLSSIAAGLEELA